MKYNRALDYTALALASLKDGKPALAARLLAKAGAQNDLTAAIATLEVSNKQAFALEAKRRVRANDLEKDIENEELDADADPLDEIEEADDDELEAEFDDELAPEEEMAKVLSKMFRRK
jgi:hypothetical protein